MVLEAASALYRACTRCPAPSQVAAPPALPHFAAEATLFHHLSLKLAFGAEVLVSVPFDHFKLTIIEISHGRFC